MRKIRYWEYGQTKSNVLFCSEWKTKYWIYYTRTIVSKIEFSIDSKLQHVLFYKYCEYGIGMYEVTFSVENSSGIQILWVF